MDSQKDSGGDDSLRDTKKSFLALLDQVPEDASHVHRSSSRQSRSGQKVPDDNGRRSRSRGRKKKIEEFAASYGLDVGQITETRRVKPYKPKRKSKDAKHRDYEEVSDEISVDARSESNQGPAMNS